MTAFEYEIVVGKDDRDSAGGVIWFLASDMRKPISDNLPEILNVLGREGWEVVVLGDVGFDARTEIILKRQI